MTTIPATKAVIRQTDVSIQHRPLIVAIHGRFLAVRLKGTHQWFTVDHEAIWQMAMKREYLKRTGRERV